MARPGRLHVKNGLVLTGVLAVITALAFSCVPHPVGPARTFAKYESKARSTAEAALSAVETVRLAADTAAEDRAFGPYLSVLVSEQEEALSGVQGTFGSIQPPDDQADVLRSELEAILSDALDHVTDVRIAVRRGELTSLEDVANPLNDDVVALEEFLREHGG